MQLMHVDQARGEKELEVMHEEGARGEGEGFLSKI